MEFEQKQIWTYLNWLQESGQIYARDADPLPESGAPEPLEASPAIEAAPPRKKLIFFCVRHLDSSEKDMVERIATALGLKAVDFAVSTPAEPLLGEFCIVLGQDSETAAPSRTVTIPHPSAMLRDPSLKRSAWDALQTLKDQLT